MPLPRGISSTLWILKASCLVGSLLLLLPALREAPSWTAAISSLRLLLPPEHGDLRALAIIDVSRPLKQRPPCKCFQVVRLCPDAYTHTWRSRAPAAIRHHSQSSVLETPHILLIKSSQSAQNTLLSTTHRPGAHKHHLIYLTPKPASISRYR